MTDSKRSKDYEASSKKHRVDIDKEVQQLFDKGYLEYGKIPESEVIALRNKYKDEEIVDKIHEAMKRSADRIRKRVAKFTEHMYEKYKKGVPLTEIVEKALAYRKKLSDFEFAEFYKIIQKKIASQDFTSSVDEYIVPRRSRMNKLLGTIEQDIVTSKLNVGTKDLPILQEILHNSANQKGLHMQATLQALTFRDLQEESLLGQFNREKHNPASHIHPVLAALFLHKIDLFEKNMIYASIANVVKARKEGKVFNNESDANLHYNLVTDNTDVVCDSENALGDLKIRSDFQAKLWECIIKLRLGQYYDQVATDFILALNSCKMNMYDAPDLIYTKDEITIIRKLLSIFGLRPTVVATSPAYNLNMMGYEAMGLYAPQQMFGQKQTLTAIPMLTFRLPLVGQNIEGKQLHLNNVLKQPQLYFEDKGLTLKQQEVLYSNEVLIICVQRRKPKINVPRIHTPYHFRKLPLTILSDSKIDTREVEFDNVITLGNDENRVVYHLASVVCSDTTDENVSLGTSAILIRQFDPLNGSDKKEHILYDPVGAFALQKLGKDSTTFNRPMTTIQEEMILRPGDEVALGESFRSRAGKTGTIFIYVNRDKAKTKAIQQEMQM